MKKSKEFSKELKLDSLYEEMIPYQKKRIKTFSDTRLFPNKGKEYVDVAFYSDQHIGCIHSDFKLIKKYRDYFLKNSIYVFLGGDLIEGSTRYSVGAGVYEQLLAPDEQFHFLVEFLKPLADEELLISAIRGNHEERFKKTVGLDITNTICCMLGIPYLGTGGFNIIRIGDQRYTIYYEHGTGGAKYFHTKAKKIFDASQAIDDCDVYAWGHVHELASWISKRRKICSKNKHVKYTERLLVFTGHYLKYEHSYAQDTGLYPSKLGSAILRFYSNKHKVVDITSE